MTSLPSAPLDVALVGAGTVGTAVATLLQRRGHRIATIWSRSPASAKDASARLKAPVGDLSAAAGVDLVLLGVPAHALAEVAGPLSTTESVVVHFAGSVGIAPLQGLEDAAALCALHPVQACPDVDTAVDRLPGSAWGVTCSPKSEDWARELIQSDLAGSPVTVREEDRALWHAAAVTTSNGISALIAIGEMLLGAIDIAAPHSVLHPIAAGTVMNAKAAGGGAAALTGPVVRREADVIRGHLEAVTATAPSLLDPYLHTLRTIVSSARASGRIEDADAEHLSSLLERR